MQITYHNPVYSEYFADPFVLLVDGVYYAYGTGSGVLADGRAFPVLRSRDLVQWEALGGALELPGGAASSMCWAPEVVERDGQFFLFYSSALGDEANHRLRVAVADDPAGPFRDTGGLLLPDEGFSIDAHPFRDPRDADGTCSLPKTSLTNVLARASPLHRWPTTCARWLARRQRLCALRRTGKSTSVSAPIMVANGMPGTQLKGRLCSSTRAAITASTAVAPG